MDAKRTLSEKRNEILTLAERHGLRNVRVFGSMAREGATAASDVDLLVDLDPGTSLLDIGRLKIELEELLGGPVDVVTENALHWYIRERVVSEAVPL